MNTKKLKEYKKNPPIVKIHGVKLINFSKIIEETILNKGTQPGRPLFANPALQSQPIII